MRYRFSSFIKDDLAEITDYIAKDSPAQAAKLIGLFRQSFAHIASTPLLYRVRSEIAQDIRLMPIGSYVILFRLLRDFVRIERVVHGSRDLSILSIGDR